MLKLERSQLELLVRHAIAFGAAALSTAFLYTKIPHDNTLMAVPESLLLLTLVLPILAWQDLSSPKARKKIAATASIVIWCVGLILAFQIGPKSNLIYIPDAMILFGFIPVLYVWPFSWTWIIFGLLNAAIGFFLQMIACMPDGLFPATVLPAKRHLADFHPPITWWLIGIPCLFFGIVRLLCNLLQRFSKSRSGEAPPS